MRPKIHIGALAKIIFNNNDLILGEWCFPDSKKKFLLYHWDKEIREMRPQGNKFFEILKKLGMLHYDNISLIKTLNFAKSIGYLKWWESKKKEKEFLEFKQNYLRQPNKKLLKYLSLLKV